MSSQWIYSGNVCIHINLCINTCLYFFIHLHTYLSIYLWKIYLSSKLRLCTVLFVFSFPVMILFSKLKVIFFFLAHFNMVMFLIFNLVSFFLVCIFCFCSPTTCLVLIVCLFREGERVMRHITVVLRLRALQNDILREMSLPPHYCYLDSMSHSFHQFILQLPTWWT